MPDFRAIYNSDDKIFDSVLLKVNYQFDIKRKDHTIGLKLLSRFDQLKNYLTLYVHKVTEFKGNTNSFIILLAEKHLTVNKGRKVRQDVEVEEIEPILIFNAPVDMGKVFITKETIADKIADLFYKVDIDFKEYPTFSKNYFVVGEKPELVKIHLPKGLIESLDKIEDMTVEINGNWGLVRPEKNLTENLLLLMVSIGFKMTK